MTGRLIDGSRNWDKGTRRGRVQIHVFFFFFFPFVPCSFLFLISVSSRLGFVGWFEKIDVVNWTGAGLGPVALARNSQVRPKTPGPSRSSRLSPRSQPLPPPNPLRQISGWGKKKKL